jgi:hypothetical protein
VPHRRQHSGCKPSRRTTSNDLEPKRSLKRQRMRMSLGDSAACILIRAGCAWDLHRLRRSLHSFNLAVSSRSEMAPSLSLSRFVCFVLLSSHALARVCYWPNGEAAIGQTPCFPDKKDSACCNPGDFCTSTGFCFSNSVTYYSRQSCTDMSYQSDSCVKDCIASTLLPYKIRRFAAVY